MSLSAAYYSEQLEKSREENTRLENLLESACKLLYEVQSDPAEWSADLWAWYFGDKE